METTDHQFDTFSKKPPSKVITTESSRNQDSPSILDQAQSSLNNIGVSAGQSLATLAGVADKNYLRRSSI